MTDGSGQTGWNEHIRNADRAQKEGKYDYAEAMWMLSVDEAESFGTADRRLAYSLEKLTECLWFQGRLQEALEYGTRALQIYEQALGAGHADVGSMAYNLAMVHHMLNSFGEAERLYKRALAVKTSALGAKHPEVVKVLGSFADLLNKLGRVDEAQQLRATERMVTAANWSQTDAGRDIGAQQGIQPSDRMRTASVTIPPGALPNPGPGGAQGATGQPPINFDKMRPPLPSSASGQFAPVQQSTSGPYPAAQAGGTPSGTYPPVRAGGTPSGSYPPAQQSTSGPYPPVQAGRAPSGSYPPAQQSTSGPYPPVQAGGTPSGAYPPVQAGGTPSGAYPPVQAGGTPSGAYPPVQAGGTPSGAYPPVQAGGTPSGAYPPVQAGGTPSGTYPPVQSGDMPSGSFQSHSGSYPPVQAGGPPGASGSVLTRLQAIKNAAKLQTNVPVESEPSSQQGQDVPPAQSAQAAQLAWGSVPQAAEPASAPEPPQKTSEDFARAAAALASPPTGSFGKSWDEIKDTAEQSLQLEDYDKSECAWRECLMIARGQDENNPCYCFVLEKLGDVFIRKNHYAEAEDCFRTSYNIKKAVLGDTHQAVASAVNNLARLYFTNNDYPNAELYGDEAVRVTEKLFGPNSVEVASALHNLATVYHVQKKFERAEPYYERSMKLKQLLLGGDHPETVKLLKAYANLLRSTHREEQADHLDQCVTGMISGRWRVMKTPEPEEGWWKQEIFGQE